LGEDESPFDKLGATKHKSVEYSELSSLRDAHEIVEFPHWAGVAARLVKEKVNATVTTSALIH